MNCLRHLLYEDDGPTAVEYAVILALITLVVATGISAFGSAQNNYWGRIDNQLQAHGFR